MTGKPIEAFGRDASRLDGEATKAAVREADAPTPVGDEREAIARIIDPGTWHDRDAYVRLMTTNGGCPLETVNAIADRRVRDSLAKADAILARLSPDRGQAEALEQYERGIHDASIWLRDQQHQNPPDSLWHAAAILADRMNAALLPATPSDRGQAMSTPDDGGRAEEWATLELLERIQEVQEYLGWVPEDQITVERNELRLDDYQSSQGNHSYLEEVRLWEVQPGEGGKLRDAIIALPALLREFHDHAAKSYSRSLATPSTPGVREALEDQTLRLGRFRDAVEQLPWVAKRLRKGQQFNTYESGRNDENAADEDRVFYIGIGPISDFRFIGEVEGKAQADLIEAGLKLAALSALSKEQVR